MVASGTAQIASQQAAHATGHGRTHAPAAPARMAIGNASGGGAIVRWVYAATARLAGQPQPAASTAAPTGNATLTPVNVLQVR
jgi:hypothetical protein